MTSRPEPWLLRSFLPVLLLAAIVIGVGALAFSDLRAALDRLSTRVEAQERTLQLYRFEQRTKTGLGLSALLEQLRYWAPQAGGSGASAAHLAQIEEQIVAILAAFRGLGPEAFADLVKAFETEGDDEVRNRLLTAMVEVDSERAKSYTSRVAQGLDLKVSTRVRRFAAERLVKLDRTLAAETLRGILGRETHAGLDPNRLDAELRAKYPNAQANVGRSENFWTFVQSYLGTADPETVPTLLAIVGRRDEHDVVTLQEVVKALGQLRAPEAVTPVQRLFESPPLNHHPMFRNHCLDALGQIRGAQACEWFRDRLRQEQHELVRNKLLDLIQKLCS